MVPYSEIPEAILYRGDSIEFIESKMYEDKGVFFRKVIFPLPGGYVKFGEFRRVVIQLPPDESLFYGSDQLKNNTREYLRNNIKNLRQNRKKK